MTTADDLLSLPFDRPGPLRIAPALLAIQVRPAITRVRTGTGDQAWLITRHQDVRQLYGDDRLGNSHPAPDRAPRLSNNALFGGPTGNFETEHADRARMRSLLLPFFSPRRMEILRSRVGVLVDMVIDDLADQGPPADLHNLVSEPLPILVICELLGVPVSDRGRFRAWTQAIADTANRDRSQQGLADLLDYAQWLVAQKRMDPGDDVISGLCAGTKPVEDGYISLLATVLLFAGNETTVTRIDLAALLLLAYPDQWNALAADPDRMHDAIEEILRVAVAGTGMTPRYARETFRFGDMVIQEGDLVLLSNAAANHDQHVFADPARFDIARKPGPHLAFGYGAHYCIGAPLARMELGEVLRRLMARFPDMRLAVPVEEVTLRRDVLTGGLAELPVTWS